MIGDARMMVAAVVCDNGICGHPSMQPDRRTVQFCPTFCGWVRLCDAPNTPLNSFPWGGFWQAPYPILLSYIYIVTLWLSTFIEKFLHQDRPNLIEPPV
jgi:hypothetical protein